jgi:glutathione synthase
MTLFRRERGLAKAAGLLVHEVWYIGVGDFRIGEPDGVIGAHG